MSVDVSEIRKFVEDLHDATVKAAAESRKVVTKAAQNIKTDARKTLRSQTKSGSLDWLTVATSYDITSGDGETYAEIGPDQSISGLGRGVEFGSRNHAPMPFLVPAFEREDSKFMDALVKAVTDPFKAL